jgi:hypothetical protein
MLGGTAEQTEAAAEATLARGTAASDEDLAFRGALEVARRKRSRRTVVLLLAVFAIGFGGATFRRTSRRLDAIRHASRAWSAYSGCMLGGPLAPGETVPVRLRRMELSLPGAAGAATSGRDDASAKNEWPSVCARHAQELDQVIVSDHLEAEASFRPLHELAARAAQNPTWSAEPSLAGELWAAAGAAGLDAQPPEAGSKAPPPAHPLTVATLLPLPLPAGMLGEREETLDPRNALVLFSRPRDPATLLCAFGLPRPPGPAAKPMAEVRCEDGLGVLADRSTRPASFVRTQKDHFDSFELVRAREGGEPRVLALSSDIRAASLFGDQLVYVKPGPARPDLLFARDAARDGPLGDPVPLGELEAGAHELAACATGEATIARVRSYQSDRAGRHGNQSASSFAFHDPAAAPDGAAGAPGSAWATAPRAVITDSTAALTCRAREATLTWLDGDGIAQARCSPDACTDRTSGALARPWTHMQPLLAADLDGKALLVGITDGSGPFSEKLVHSVRMRLAPLDEIAQAPDIVLWGDAAHEGAAPTALRLVPAEGAALVIVTTEDGANRAIRIDPGGQFEPVQVTRN